MAYIPADAKWYVAELIEQITIEGDLRSVVHKNLVLIRADSPDEAYEKAFALGYEGEDSYENPSGKNVRVTFRGLGELNVIHENLEHGAELLYEENIGLSDEDIAKLILTKDQLSVFRKTGSLKSPDYSAKEVVEDAIRSGDSS